MKTQNTDLNFSKSTMVELSEKEILKIHGGSINVVVGFSDFQIRIDLC